MAGQAHCWLDLRAQSTRGAGGHFGQLQGLPSRDSPTIRPPSQGLHVLTPLYNDKNEADWYPCSRERGVVGLRISRNSLLSPLLGDQGSNVAPIASMPAFRKAPELATGSGRERSNMQTAYIHLFSAFSNHNPAAMSCHLGQAEQLFRKTHGDSQRKEKRKRIPYHHLTHCMVWRKAMRFGSFSSQE